MKNLVDDSVITCYEIIDTAETIWNISNNKKVNIKGLLRFPHFLLVTILLLTIPTICYYFIKHQLKQNDILPY